MDWLNQIGGMLQKYTQTQPGTAHDDAEQDFERVANQVPHSTMAGAVSEIFNSSATPAFPQLLGQLFNNSGPQQKASILNLLMSVLGSGALSQVVSKYGGSLAGAMASGSNATITPEQAQQIPPTAITEAAQHAQSKEPSIVDQISDIYARQPGIVKTLGAAALTVGLIKLGRDHKLL